MTDLREKAEFVAESLWTPAERYGRLRSAPQYLAESWNGSGQIIEAMRERGYICELHFDQTKFSGSVAIVTAGFTRGQWYRESSADVHEAILNAAYEALREQSSE